LRSLREELQNELKNVREKNQQLASSEENVKKLTNQLSDLQKEKIQIENERITPERYMKMLQEKESLKEELKSERKRRQTSDERAEEFVQEGLSDTIETKLQTKKNELQQLKFSANKKLGSDQEVLLKDLLDRHEALEVMLFEEVNQKSRSFTQAQKKLQEAKDNLIDKLDDEEIEEICQLQTEII
ncbi:31453_t:CDS:1, partial [Racocetra persica]